MCGIVGILGEPSGDNDKMFSDMLQMDVVRGPHSTGIAAVTATGKPEVVKGTLLPTDLIETEEYRNAVNRRWCHTLIGHNRWATVGKVTDENAHPFQCGKITLVHNGTITSKYNLPDAFKFNTDSEAITNSIDRIGIKETWKLIEGPALLVYWDEDKQACYMISNGKRPLTYSYFNGGNNLMFSSEQWTLRAAAHRAGKKLQARGGNYVFVLKDNMLYEWKYDFKKKSLSMTTEKLEAAPPPKIVHVGKGKKNNSYNPYTRDWEEDLHTFISDAHDKEDKDSDPFGLDDSLGPPPLPVLAQLRENARSSFAKAELEKSNKIDQSSIKNSNEARAKLEASSVGLIGKGLALNRPSEKEFHERYTECLTCGESLRYEYETATLIDRDKALCNDCTTTNYNNGVIIK